MCTVIEMDLKSGDLKWMINVYNDLNGFEKNINDLKWIK